MAKINKDIKKSRNLEIKDTVHPWFENKNLALRARTLLFTNTYNKIQRIRSFSKHYASRAARYGALAIVSVLLLFIFYSYFLPKNRFQLAKESILKNPQDFEAHLVLAEEFLKKNDLLLAEKELISAKIIQQSANTKKSAVLGVASKLDDLFNEWQLQNPEELKKLIANWEKIVSETPSYRDGYLYLTLYNFKLGNIKKAKENLQKAIELDPNYQLTREIEKVLK